MKIYKIKVNGKTYKVELEAIEEVKGSEKPLVETKKEEAKVSVPTSGEGNEVLAPIQGVVIAIKVNVGDKVKKGQTVVVVEAMKLENEVSSPFDGVVSEILVTKGANVSNKQVMLRIK